MMAERDTWDALLVIKMDRIHRNSRNFMEMMENLQRWGKDFVSASESLDTSTAMGRFVMDIIQRIAQLESEQIGERVKMGMTQKARVGPGILGFHPPLGYNVAEGRLVPIEAEAEVVREMFDLCLEGRTLEETAADLNANGRRTKRDTAWTPIKVYRILHNPVSGGRPLVLGSLHALRVNPRDASALFFGVGGRGASETVRRTGLERARGVAPGPRTAERGGTQQRGEEGERVPDLRESLRLRLRRRRAPSEERGGPRGLVDFPTLPRG